MKVIFYDYRMFENMILLNWFKKNFFRFFGKFGIIFCFIYVMYVLYMKILLWIVLKINWFLKWK